MCSIFRVNNPGLTYPSGCPKSGLTSLFVNEDLLNGLVDYNSSLGWRERIPILVSNKRELSHARRIDRSHRSLPAKCSRIRGNLQSRLGIRLDLVGNTCDQCRPVPTEALLGGRYGRARLLPRATVGQSVALLKRWRPRDSHGLHRLLRLLSGPRARSRRDPSSALPPKTRPVPPRGADARPRWLCRDRSTCAPRWSATACSGTRPRRPSRAAPPRWRPSVSRRS